MASNDFSRRAVLTEWMDEPCSTQELYDCLRDLERVNRLVLVYRPTLRFVARVAATHPGRMHIVDVGCGGGDMLRVLERWAERRSISLQLTGVDSNERAIDFARTRTPASSCIRYVCGDAAADPEVRDVDLIISSHMTHHLDDEEIVLFLRWMEETARVGWFINDLHREPVPYHLFGLLAAVMRWHRFIRHDGPVSVLRSFQPGDWERYLSLAKIDGAEIATYSPGRLCVQREMPHA